MKKIEAEMNRLNKKQEELIQFGEDLFLSCCLRKPFSPTFSEDWILKSMQIIPTGEEIGMRNIFCMLSGKGCNSFFPIAPLQLGRVWHDHSTKEMADAFLIEKSSLPSGRGKFDSFYYLMDKYGARINTGDPDISVAHYWKVLAALVHCCNPDDIDKNPLMLFSGDVSGLVEFMKTKTSNMAAKNARARSFFIQLLSDAILRAVLRHFELPRCNLLFYGASRFMLLLPGDEESQQKLNDIEKTISIRLLQLYRGLLAPQFAREMLAVKELFDEQAFPEHLGNLWKKSSISSYRLFQNIPDEFFNAFEPIGIGTLQTCSWCGAEINSEERYKIDNSWFCSECKNFGWTMENILGLAQTIAHAYHKGHVLTIRDITHGKSLKETNWEELKANLDAKVNKHFSSWTPADPNSLDRPTWREGLSYFGYEYEFRKLEDIPKQFDGEIIQFNPGLKNSISLSSIPKNATYGWRWAGFATPMIEREDEKNKFDVKDTEQFAKDVPNYSDPQQYGVRRFGTLYLDGDGMGKLFKNCRSIFHYLSLSDNVALFFEGWVNKLCQKAVQATLPGLKNEEEQTAYLLYAGGDDLFIAGPWIVLPELAFQIYRHYSHFVTKGTVPDDDDESVPQEPPVTISATMSIAGEKFPLYHLLLNNLERIKSTKDFWSTFSDAGFNTRHGACVDFFGQSMPWQDFETAMKIVKDFSACLLPEPQGIAPKLPRNFLQRLYSIAEQYKIETEELKDIEQKKESEAKKAKQKSYYKRAFLTNELFLGRWVWLCIYSLTRAAYQLKPEYQEVREKIMTLQENLIINKYKITNLKNDTLQLIQKLMTITRWLELRTRKESEKNE